QHVAGSRPPTDVSPASLHVVEYTTSSGAQWHGPRRGSTQRQSRVHCGREDGYISHRGSHPGSSGAKRRMASRPPQPLTSRPSRFGMATVEQKFWEDIAMTPRATLALGLMAFGLIASPATDPASGQAGDGWLTLFDGKNLDQWQGEAGENAVWRIEDGS